jgi:hypothetical protein
LHGFLLLREKCISHCAVLRFRWHVKLVRCHHCMHCALSAELLGRATDSPLKFVTSHWADAQTPFQSL